MTRYNIALIPNQHSELFIEQAKSFANDEGIDYLLGKNSLPHITLVQFRTEDPKLLTPLWESVIKKFTSLNMQNIPLTLQGLDWFHDLKRENFLWLQLTPLEETVLRTLHYQMIVCLAEFKLAPINRSLENFTPHLTLAHTQNLSYIDSAANYPITIYDNFSIALGELDEIGQLLNLKFSSLAPITPVGHTDHNQ